MSADFAFRWCIGSLIARCRWLTILVLFFMPVAVHAQSAQDLVNAYYECLVGTTHRQLKAVSLREGLDSVGGLSGQVTAKCEPAFRAVGRNMQRKGLAQTKLTEYGQIIRRRGEEKVLEYLLAVRVIATFPSVRLEK